MPRASANASASVNPDTRQVAAALPGLLAEAMDFVPAGRADQIVRKFVSGGHVFAQSAAQQKQAIGDAMEFAGDLLLSQPSSSGSTAFDRLLRNRPRAPAAERQAMTALVQARYRVLSLSVEHTGGQVTGRDPFSADSVSVFGINLPISGPLTVFCRVAILAPGMACCAGPVTPLDDAAHHVAMGHMAAGATGVAANARWAEAVFMHVVRIGTMNVPGLNRPSEASLYGLFDEHSPLAGLGRDWRDLAGAPAGADLLRCTRQLANAEAIVAVLDAIRLTRDMDDAKLGGALERLILVMIDTIHTRQRYGSGDMSLDGVARLIARHITIDGAPAELARMFAALRLKVTQAGVMAVDDPALSRLLQRIQGLRAKTTDRGCTEQEAMAAAEKVAELLDRHGLSLGELDFKTQACDGEKVTTKRRRMAPIDNCMPVIANFFDCRVWMEQNKGDPLRYVFFGLRADVAAARYLYELVERAFEDETDAFRAGPLYAAMAGERRTATHSFQLGMSRGITVKLQTLQAARDTKRRSVSGRDLVLVKTSMVDEELDKLGLELEARGGARVRHVLSEAYATGEQAGALFAWEPAISDAA
jgi:hypothetical protein